MKKIFSLLLIVLFSVSTYAQSDEVKAQVEEINKAMVESMLNNDPDAILDYYAEDVISMPSYQPMIRGMEEMKQAVEMQKQQPMDWNDFQMETIEILESGNFVIDVGTYSMSMNIPQMPQPYTDKGKYITVFEKQDDGSLKIKLDTWNTDSNPWAMVSGEGMMHEGEMHEGMHQEEMEEE